MIYVDGKLAAQFSQSSPIRAASSGFTVSGYNCADSLGRVFNRCLTGKMTRICMWNKRLTASEVMDDYIKGASDPASNDLIHYWKVTGSCQQEILDLVGNWNLIKHGDDVTLSEDTPWKS